MVISDTLLPDTSTEAADTEWQAFNPLFPRRTIDGGWTTGEGKVWRRRVNGKWQYKQDPETEEEWTDRNMTGF